MTVFLLCRFLSILFYRTSFVAWDQTTIAGTSLCETVDGIGEIIHLGVRRSWRRKGLDMQLLRASLNEFYRRGIHTVKLNVDAESLTNAHLLYERAGFKAVDAYMNYNKIISTK